MCSERKRGFCAVASWQRDGGQNTAMTARGGRKEVSGSAADLREGRSWRRDACKVTSPRSMEAECIKALG